MPPSGPIGRRLFVLIEGKLRLDMILYAFWAVFWLLNGLDKFFKPTGPVIREANPVLIQGWFGLDRDQKFADYFAKLHLEGLAVPSLYGFAVLEIALGLLFVGILVHPRMPAMLYRLGFKLSLLIFLAFSTGDILFGDRMELWEHGTFMILVLLTYHLYLMRSTEHAEVVGRYFPVVDENRDNRISTEEFDSFMERLRRNCTTLETAGGPTPRSHRRAR